MRRGVVERRIAGAHQLARAGRDVAPLENFHDIEDHLQSVSAILIFSPEAPQPSASTTRIVKRIHRAA